LKAEKEKSKKLINEIGDAEEQNRQLLKKLAQAKGSIRRGDSRDEDSKSFDDHSSN